MRRNRHEFIKKGWVHEQDNQKILSQGHVVVAEEKGYNTYTKVDDAQCESARVWWQDNHHVWNFIQQHWNELYATKTELKFKSKVDGKTLWMNLFAWADENVQSVLNNSKKVELQKIVEKFLE